MKRPCVRLPLATITTAVITVLAVFNLVRLRFGVKCREKVIAHAAIFTRAMCQSCHAKLQSTVSSGRLSIRSFLFPLQCFIQTRLTECSSDNADLTNSSQELELYEGLFYLPVSDAIIKQRQKY